MSVEEIVRACVKAKLFQTTDFKS